MIFFSEAALADLEKIFEFNADRDPAMALDHINKIQSAVTVLELHPEIGRRVAPGSPLRELVIAQGQAGYVALYEYSPLANRIRILAVRHQREAGHQDG
ncbi:MAG: type II toxin-antitoxin system RelE/ParE family toxin [Burkholderiales bacterium]|nr:type II toxin-antitoxin system RelE/ParE family toxin [Burkholderiales bacterium]MDP2399861.1 type II toxin-antitoxin system RelE/ParE family toxin [Burkholderiales bacterium]